MKRRKIITFMLLICMALSLTAFATVGGFNAKASDPIVITQDTEIDLSTAKIAEKAGFSGGGYKACSYDSENGRLYFSYQPSWVYYSFGFDVYDVSAIEEVKITIRAVTEEINLLVYRQDNLVMGSPNERIALPNNTSTEISLKASTYANSDGTLSDFVIAFATGATSKPAGYGEVVITKIVYTYLNTTPIAIDKDTDVDLSKITYDAKQDFSGGGHAKDKASYDANGYITVNYAENAYAYYSLWFNKYDVSVIDKIVFNVTAIDRDIAFILYGQDNLVLSSPKERFALTANTATDVTVLAKNYADANGVLNNIIFSLADGTYFKASQAGSIRINKITLTLKNTDPIEITEDTVIDLSSASFRADERFEGAGYYDGGSYNATDKVLTFSYPDAWRYFAFETTKYKMDNVSEIHVTAKAVSRDVTIMFYAQNNLVLSAPKQRVDLVAGEETEITLKASDYVNADGTFDNMAIAFSNDGTFMPSAWGSVIISEIKLVLTPKGEVDEDANVFLSGEMFSVDTGVTGGQFIESGLTRFDGKVVMARDIVKNYNYSAVEFTPTEISNVCNVTFKVFPEYTTAIPDEDGVIYDGLYLYVYAPTDTTLEFCSAKIKLEVGEWNTVTVAGSVFADEDGKISKLTLGLFERCNYSIADGALREEGQISFGYPSNSGKLYIESIVLEQSGYDVSFDMATLDSMEREIGGKTYKGLADGSRGSMLAIQGGRADIGEDSTVYVDDDKGFYYYVEHNVAEGKHWGLNTRTHDKDGYTTDYPVANEDDGLGASGTVYRKSFANTWTHPTTLLLFRKQIYAKETGYLVFRMYLDEFSETATLGFQTTSATSAYPWAYQITDLAGKVGRWVDISVPAKYFKDKDGFVSEIVIDYMRGDAECTSEESLSFYIDAVWYNDVDRVKEENVTAVDFSEFAPVSQSGMTYEMSANTTETQMAYYRKDFKQNGFVANVTLTGSENFEFFFTLKAMGKGDTAGGYFVWFGKEKLSVGTKIADDTKWRLEESYPEGFAIEDGTPFKVEILTTQYFVDLIPSGYYLSVKINDELVLETPIDLFDSGTLGSGSGLYIYPVGSGEGSITVTPVDFKSGANVVEGKIYMSVKELKVGEEAKLRNTVSGSFDGEKVSGYTVIEGAEFAEIDGNYLVAKKAGKVKVRFTVTNQFGTFSSEVFEVEILAGENQEPAKKEEKGGCFGNVNGELGLLSVALFAGVAIIRRRKERV